MLPSVLVTIPTFNRPELTTRAIDSVLAQDYRGELDIYVYDDGSGDPYAYSDDHEVPGYAYIRGLCIRRDEQNRGIAHAKNQGMRDRGPDYDLHGILDSDDELLPNHISRCVEALQANPDVDVVYTDDIDHNDATGVRVATPAADWNDGLALLSCALRGDTWLARWSALERSGLHDERFELEVDYDLFYALHRSGARFQRIPGASVVIHRHGNSATKDRTKAAYWHAAGLGKYGHSIEWAMRRAARNPEWHDAIRAGYLFGKGLRDG